MVCDVIPLQGGERVEGESAFVVGHLVRRRRGAKDKVIVGQVAPAQKIGPTSVAVLWGRRAEW